MPFLVTSASGANGDGYGALLAFDNAGKPLGTFCDDPRITDPRGLAVDRKSELLFLNSGSDRILAIDRRGKVVRDSGSIQEFNPGGGTFGPDGRYYVGSRSGRTIIAFSVTLEGPGEQVLDPGAVPFPRGFAFGVDERIFLASGIGPRGEGDNTIFAFVRGQEPLRLIADPNLSPLDLAMAPNGNIIVSSEYPFGSADAATSVREYDPADGKLVRIFSATDAEEFRKPRGLRFTPDGVLYCVAQNEVVAFDFVDGRCLGAVVRFPRLNGQAIAVFPELAP